MHTCMNASTLTCIFTCIHTCIHTYMHVHIYMHICIQTYTYANRLNTYINSHLQTYIGMYIHPYLHCILAYINIYIHTYTISVHTYRYTHIFISSDCATRELITVIMFSGCVTCHTFSGIVKHAGYARRKRYDTRPPAATCIRRVRHHVYISRRDLRTRRCHVW